MTKTKKTDTKLKETLEDKKMKHDNELFNQKLDKINKPILEIAKKLNDLMEQVEEIEKGTEGKVFESDLDYITRRLKDLSEYNEENFTELKKVAKQIQKKNLQILDSVLNEKQFKEFKKKGKIEVAINGTINEEQKKIVEALNGKFITEKTLLIFPLWIEGGIKQDELKLFQEDFENVSKQVEEKWKLLDKYFQYQSRIIYTNNQVGQIQQLFFVMLPKYQGQELSKDTIDLTNENVFNFFSDIQEKINNAKVDEKTLFELATDTESDYKISFIYDEEKKETRFTFEKGINISGHSIDILNPRIQELEKENKRLQDKLKETEENQKAIEESQHNFKDIKMKTQAISVYKPYTKIFLRSEEITKYFEKWDSVTLPFGLKIENQNEVKYNITKWNYEHTDKDLKYYNACISTQWNLLKNNYPINTFIEEVALYQIYKGDDTFTYKPSTKELEEMKEALLGMNSNQAKMTFEKNYSYLKEKQKLRYTTEGTILPVRYVTYEIEGKNGRKYSKKGYIFSELIPLFSFFNDIGQINTAPLKVESILQNSSMNDEITRVLKELIAQLYYFKSNSKTSQGYERKVYITEEGEELSLKQWNERRIDYKKQNKKLKGYWAYKTRRTIDSLIKDCKFVINKKGGQRIILKEGEEKSLDTKTKQRFIDSIIKFLRESKNIPYTEKGTYIKDFVLYNNKDKIIDEEDYFTEDDKKNLKKEIEEYCQNQMNRRAKNESFTDSEYKKELKKLIQAKEKKEIKRNPTISKIDIYIS